jgi:hypothetical protein
VAGGSTDSPAAEARFVRWRMNTQVRLWVSGPLLAACSLGRPQLSELPVPEQLTLRQAAFAVVQAYVTEPSHRLSSTGAVAWLGIDAAELPPGSVVTADSACPRPPSAPAVLRPRQVRLAPDSLRMTVHLMVCGAGRGGRLGEMELRRRPGRMWTVWRWQLEVVS